jgi:glutaredoxin
LPAGKVGQVSAAPSARVVLLGKPGCHLCDEARAVVARVVADLDETYLERDVTLDPAALCAYGESIPVVFVDGIQVDFWRVSEARLRAALATTTRSE